MDFSSNEILKARRTLKKAPPPKVPLSPSSDQNGANLSSGGSLSVASARNKFQPTSPTKAPRGSFVGQNGGDASDVGVVSVASARARFERAKAVEKPGPQPMLSNKRNVLVVNNNIHCGEPPRKPLPQFFRIGAAPRKPAKPDHLRLLLGKFKNKIITSSSRANGVLQNRGEGLHDDQSEEVYDDVESVLHGNEAQQDDQSQEMYDDVQGVLGRNEGYQSEELYESVDSRLTQEDNYEVVERAR